MESRLSRKVGTGKEFSSWQGRWAWSQVHAQIWECREVSFEIAKPSRQLCKQIWGLEAVFELGL